MSRAHEFDARFRPKTRRLRQVIREIEAQRPAGIDLPIDLYRVDEAHFVVDGHKRLALAIARGQEMIDAQVSEYVTRYRVDGSTRAAALRLTAAERRFREETGLDRADPQARFPVSDPSTYLELSESVRAHAYDLCVEGGRLLPPVETARHWLEEVYRPAIAEIKTWPSRRLLASCTDADAYLLARPGNRHPLDNEWRYRTEAVERARGNLEAARHRGWRSRLPGPNPSPVGTLPERD